MIKQALPIQPQSQLLPPSLLISLGRAGRQNHASSLLHTFCFKQVVPACCPVAAVLQDTPPHEPVRVQLLQHLIRNAATVAVRRSALKSLHQQHIELLPEDGESCGSSAAGGPEGIDAFAGL